MPTTTDFLEIVIPDENDTSWTADMLDAFTKLDGVAETVSGTHMTASGTSLKGVVDVQGIGTVSIHPSGENAVVISGSNGIPKTIMVENPNGAENISFFVTSTAETVSKIIPTLSGVGADPGITWSLRFDTDRFDQSGASELITGGTNTHRGNTGSSITTFDDATIPADSFVWVTTTSVSGAVDELSINLFL